MFSINLVQQNAGAQQWKLARAHQNVVSNMRLGALLCLSPRLLFQPSTKAIAALAASRLCALG
jgi:hypothetical protein